MSNFPQLRLRRLREISTLRQMVRETKLSVSDFVYPVFVTHGHDVKNEIDAIPGIHQFSLDRLLSEIKEISDLGIESILLFGVPPHKNSNASEAYDPKGIVQEAIRMIKQTVPELLVITDVCICSYTDSGHCGLIIDNKIDNDSTLELLGSMALSHVKSGADLVAPSAMMDGQVTAIRTILDSAGFESTPIMSYSAKYASSFYGPFRVAAESTPQSGNRSSYQIDYSNVRQAIREVEQDIKEGADIVMVKPALAYMDVLSKIKAGFDHPLVAYNVSGEYAMVKAASHNRWIDGKKITFEILTSIKRAGADMIITYHAKEVARWLNQSTYE